MTPREAAIVSAYTGSLCGSIGYLYEYLKEKLGRPVMTHEIPCVLQEYQEVFKSDFTSMEIKEDSKTLLCIDKDEVTPAETHSRLSLKQSTELSLDVLELIIGKLPDATADDVICVISTICFDLAEFDWEFIVSNLSNKEEEPHP